MSPADGLANRSGVTHTLDELCRAEAAFVQRLALHPDASTFQGPARPPAAGPTESPAHGPIQATR